jgi:hypothetical protein
MMRLTKVFGVLMACALLVTARVATGQPVAMIPAALTTPDKVDTRIGKLEFKDGARSKETLGSNWFDDLRYPAFY